MAYSPSAPPRFVYCTLMVTGVDSTSNLFITGSFISLLVSSTTASGILQLAGGGGRLWPRAFLCGKELFGRCVELRRDGCASGKLLRHLSCPVLVHAGPLQLRAPCPSTRSSPQGSPSPSAEVERSSIRELSWWHLSPSTVTPPWSSRADSTIPSGTADSLHLQILPFQHLFADRGHLCHIHHDPAAAHRVLGSHTVAGVVSLNGTLLVPGVAFALSSTSLWSGTRSLTCGSNTLRPAQIVKTYVATCVGPIPTSCAYPSDLLVVQGGTAISPPATPSCIKRIVLGCSISLNCRTGWA